MNCDGERINMWTSSRRVLQRPNRKSHSLDWSGKTQEKPTDLKYIWEKIKRTFYVLDTKSDSKVVVKDDSIEFCTCFMQ